MVAPWRAEISGTTGRGVRRGGGRRRTRNAIEGRPRASPRPRPELDRPKPIITASERELREISRPRMNMGSTLLQKKARPRPGFWFAKRLLAGLASVFLLVDLGFRLALGGLGLAFALLLGLAVGFLFHLGCRLHRFLRRLGIGAHRERSGDQRNEQLLQHDFSCVDE